MSDRYKMIIDLAHHVSATRPRMSLEGRAAQFAPFAALTGHDELIRDTARVNQEEYDNPDRNKTSRGK